MKEENSFMIIDDDPTNNLLCLYAIRKVFANADIKLFEDPELALKTIETDYSKTAISTVVFLDINMSEMTAWEFLDVFKDFSDDIHKQFSIYILSSSVDHRDKEKAETNPFVLGFLSKPLSVKELVRIFKPGIADQQRA